MDEEREIRVRSHQEYLEQTDRVEKVIGSRREDFVEELWFDFEDFLKFTISQLKDEEIYNARGLRIRYSISEGKLRREGRAFLQTLSVVMDPVFGEERVFGNYEDFYSAFKHFIKNSLKDENLLFKAEPIPPRFSTESSSVEVFVYFDPAK